MTLLCELELLGTSSVVEVKQRETVDTEFEEVTAIPKSC